jgi:mannose-6-phosphate isomerase-like protein (cupin superfamily)
MKTVDLKEEAEELLRLSEEISHRALFRGQGYQAGLVLFRAAGSHPPDPSGRRRETQEALTQGAHSQRPAEVIAPKEIHHPDKDVLAYVLRGSGTLTVGGMARPLAPGAACHLPAGTPHDFSAAGEDLILFYALIDVPAKSP